MPWSVRDFEDLKTGGLKERSGGPWDLVLLPGAAANAWLAWRLDSCSHVPKSLENDGAMIRKLNSRPLNPLRFTAR